MTYKTNTIYNDIFVITLTNNSIPKSYVQVNINRLNVAFFDIIVALTEFCQ